jgi:GNAT superfamily N-acetyltransferase
MIIRKPTIDDYSAWRALWDGYNSFYGREGPTALLAEVIEKTWERFFDHSEPVHALAVELDGELAGLAHFIFHRSTTSIAPTCYLQDLFTADGARGQGVATALIDAVAVEAREEGCARLYWQTHETNVRARALYDRIAERPGFIIYRLPIAPL